MITKKFIPTGNGCGYWELKNSNGKVIRVDENSTEIREAILELEEDEE